MNNISNTEERFEDIAIHNTNNWFRYRTGGFIEHDGKYLFIKSMFADYCYMIGGAVHIGEESSECIEREVYEEAGIKARAELLSVVCENFFLGKEGNIDGKDCHVLEFYYRMKIEDMTELKKINDEGEELVWLSIDEMKKTTIMPSFITERIEEILSTEHTIHIIEDRDKRK